ncbi:hemerythrin family protein, partial [Desulfobulbus sp. US1]|nr:hemerythrin family protein [Desulfobulbus sp. US1]
KLFEIVNELTDAMKAGHGKDVLGNILDRLISYTASHFQLEENYFQQVKYPDAAAHKKSMLLLCRK